MRLKVALLFLAMAVILGAVGGVQAQSGDEAWSEPVNLSRSGAADQPRIVAAPDGMLQAFWWDRFDGLMTARFSGGAWSGPTQAPILMAEEIGEEIVTSPAVSAMPTIVNDGRGWVYAFWIGAPDRETGATPLLYSRMVVGGTSWSNPDTLAESAVAFDVAGAPSGGLALAYVRVVHSDVFPAGIYVKRTAGGGGGWSASVAAYGTIYFRLLTAEEAHVRVADGGDGAVHLAWEDPYLAQALYARSTDGGLTWSTPEALGDPDERPARPRVFALPDGNALRLWEAAGMGGCTMYQQHLSAGQGETSTWSSPQRVLEGVSACPQSERSWTHAGGALWLWGEGMSALTLAAWDVEAGHWSEARSFSFRFQDPETGRWVSLGDLHAVLTGDVLTVVGSDSGGGEVWVTVGRVEALELVFGPSLPWSASTRLSREGMGAGWPTVALDPQGGMHAAWSEAAVAGGTGTSLLYSRWDSNVERWSSAVEVLRGSSGEEMARQPALIADARDLVHVVWSGSGLGQIMHSRARLTEAAGAGGWSSPQMVSSPSLAGAWPQIGMDAVGRLYVAYVVPLNEGRGVYLTYSTDGGETWSEPEVIFDAKAAGWAMADHPALAVAPDGTLHVAWVWGAPPDTWVPRGIYHARVAGVGSGQVKVEVREVAGPGYDWPRLALAGGRVHLLYAGSGGGGVWHRSLAVESQAEEGYVWSAAVRVPGREGTAGPFGLAASGSPEDSTSSLHLVGVDAGGGALLYSTWDGSAGTAPDGGRWDSMESLSLGPEVAGGQGVAVATLPQGGRLAVAVRALAAGEGREASPVVLFTARAVPAVDVPAVVQDPTPTPTAVPTSTPVPTATPEPTPDLEIDLRTPVPALAEVMERIGEGGPLFLGGGLAVAVVVVVLVVWGVRRRER